MKYERRGQVLEESDQFLYSEELYLVFPNRWELFRSRNYTSKTLINKKDARVYNESHGCYIQRCWELIAAPKHYLESRGFKRKL